jgi:hypothetical protein
LPLFGEPSAGEPCEAAGEERGDAADGDALAVGEAAGEDLDAGDCICPPKKSVTK